MFGFLSKITSSGAKRSDEVDTVLPAPAEHSNTRRDCSAAPARQPAVAGAKRLTTRDALCSVVRDAMNASGVLSSGYTFKVLTVDPKVKKFAVLMNLSQEFDEGVTQQLFTEAVIKRLAESRFKLTVDVVYWHVARVAQRRRQRAGVAGVPSAPTGSKRPLSQLPATPTSKSGSPSEFPETQQSVPFDSDLGHMPALTNTQYGDIL